MKKLFCVAIMCLCTISALAQIEGNILDQKEKGIANAIVAAFDSTGKVIATDTSDTRGFYSLKGLQPGQYKIEARASGFLTTTKKNVEVPKEAETANKDYDTYFAIRLDIILEKGKAL